MKQMITVISCACLFSMLFLAKSASACNTTKEYETLGFSAQFWSEARMTEDAIARLQNWRESERVTAALAPYIAKQTEYKKQITAAYVASLYWDTHESPGYWDRIVSFCIENYPKVMPAPPEEKK